jgi:cell division GTPase FtsZ
LQLALIGVGRVGGAIVDSLTAYERRLDGGLVAGTVAVDTAPADLASLRAVPRTNRIAVGDAYPCRDGVDGDNELGASIAAEDVETILAGVDYLPSHRADAFLVVAALGGGTGGGGAPVVARELHRLFSRPVYGLGVLPGTDADEEMARRTLRSLVTFVREVDNLVLVDGTDDDGRVDIADLVRRLVVVFDTDRAARALSDGCSTDDHRNGNVDGRTPRTADPDERLPDDADVSVTLDDASDLQTVLEAGDISTLGYAVVPPPQRSFLERVWRLSTQSKSRVTAADVVSVVQEATLAGIDTDVAPRVEHAWVVVTGPRHALERSRAEFDRSRNWLRTETGASAVGGRLVVTADETLTATVVLSGVRNVRRLRELCERAAVTCECDDGGDQPLPEMSRWRDRTFDPLF